MLETLNTGIVQLRNYIIFILFIWIVSFTDADDLNDRISAPVYMVADAGSGTILLEHGADKLISPASLAKIMTLNLSLSDEESGILHFNQLYEIPPGGAAASMRHGSSILGLRQGDELSLLTLQRAAAMVSANDAAWTLALISNDEVDDFILRMNRSAEELGMTDTIYTDPDGWSSLSVTTGHDQMQLVLYYLRQHPGVLSLLHSQSWLYYQDLKKMNTNLLLGRVEGVDGLKTGTIPSAGFHFIATAERNSARFIVLVMGIKSSTYAESLNMRADEAEILLEWAFSNYYSWKPEYQGIIEIPVKHGATSTIGIRINDGELESLARVTLPLSDKRKFSMLVETPDVLTAPLRKGVCVGTIKWFIGSRLLAELPLRIIDDVPRQWHLKDIF